MPSPSAGSGGQSSQESTRLIRSEVLTGLSVHLDRWELFDLRNAIEDQAEAGNLPPELEVEIDPLGISDPIVGGHFRNLRIRHTLQGDFFLEGGSGRVEWANVQQDAGVNARPDDSGRARPQFDSIWGVEGEVHQDYRPGDERGLAILGDFHTALADLYRLSDQIST